MKPIDLEYIRNEILSAEESRIFRALAQARVLGYNADKFLENLLEICRFLESKRKKLYSLAELKTEIENYGLNLNDLKLSSIPGCFGALSEMTEQIDISKNEFFVFPELFTSFNQLKKINLSNNKLTELPESFGNFSLLEDLDLSVNLFVKLPASLKKIDSIKTLRLDCVNPLCFRAGLPKNLEKLCIDFTKTMAVPEEIFASTFLKTLELKGIAALPEKIAKLEKLEALLIERSGLETLPDSLLALPKLKTLSLRNQHLMTKIPDVIFQLENLEELDLSGTTLLELPSRLRQMKKLKRINISGCSDEITLMHWVKRCEAWGINRR